MCHRRLNLIFTQSPDNYDVTAEYFKSLGEESAEPKQKHGITNRFQITHKSAGDPPPAAEGIF